VQPELSAVRIQDPYLGCAVRQIHFHFAGHLSNSANCMCLRIVPETALTYPAYPNRVSGMNLPSL
jgi:hypothetical protein